MIEQKVNFTGETVFIRTYTYHYTGRVVLHSSDWIVLEDAAWVAESGRWGEAMVEGKLDEVEVYPDGRQVFICMSSIVEVTQWPHGLPRESK